jgi:hypothetical protein
MMPEFELPQRQQIQAEADSQVTSIIGHAPETG